MKSKSRQDVEQKLNESYNNQAHLSALCTDLDLPYSKKSIAEMKASILDLFDQNPRKVVKKAFPGWHRRAAIQQFVIVISVVALVLAFVSLVYTWQLEGRRQKETAVDNHEQRIEFLKERRSELLKRNERLGTQGAKSKLRIVLTKLNLSTELQQDDVDQAKRTLDLAEARILHLSGNDPEAIKLLQGMKAGDDVNALLFDCYSTTDNSLLLAHAKSWHGDSYLSKHYRAMADTIEVVEFHRLGGKKVSLDAIDNLNKDVEQLMIESLEQKEDNGSVLGPVNNNSIDLLGLRILLHSVWFDFASIEVPANRSQFSAHLDSLTDAVAERDRLVLASRQEGGQYPYSLGIQTRNNLSNAYQSAFLTFKEKAPEDEPLVKRALENVVRLDTKIVREIASAVEARGVSAMVRHALNSFEIAARTYERGELAMAVSQLQTVDEWVSNPIVVEKIRFSELQRIRVGSSIIKTDELVQRIFAESPGPIDELHLKGMRSFADAIYDNQNYVKFRPLDFYAACKAYFFVVALGADDNAGVSKQRLQELIRHISREEFSSFIDQLQIRTPNLALNVLSEELEVTNLPTSAPVAPLLILHWNVESGGNDPETIAEQLLDLGQHDIVGLSEVDQHIHYAVAMEKKWPGRYHFVHGDSGQNSGREDDQLLIAFDKTKFDFVDGGEMDEAGGVTFNNGRHRVPLYALLKDRESGVEFIVILNHLARGDASFRQQQARGLREWARTRSIPVICIGDFNFDYDFRTKKGNKAFDEFMKDNVWHWVKPEEMIDSNWSDDGKGNDRYPNSLLDFSFVAGAAKEWDATCRVLVRDGDFPDDEKTSDHRPVQLRLKR